MSRSVLSPWGPDALGRGVIVLPNQPLPDRWSDMAQVVIDEAAVRAPLTTVKRLHEAWATRQPVIIVMACDPGSFREPQSFSVEPWQAGARFEPLLDRLHFLVWANNVDARTDEPVWWWARKAIRLGAQPVDSQPGDVLLSDGSLVWIDGGPRGPKPESIVEPMVHRESVEANRLTLIPPANDPSADLAADQLAAVAHGSGPARVIAPAGSGKTRVLTERLRVLLHDRAYESSSLLAVAYNVKARNEMVERTAGLGANIRTLNALGLSLLNDALGRRNVLDEREVRRIIDDLVEIPMSRRKANTDPLSAYIEALASVRLGLKSPTDVETSRDDVDGFAVMYDEYRRELAKRNAVDFDEQIYGAIEVLLHDGVFRQRAQQSCRHLLVDEFQDLTPAHVLMLRLLALPTLDCFGVGDDDQVIYGHAGADPVFLLEFDQLFPHSAAYALEVNYRSAVPIVSAAKSLLSYNNRRIVKDIRPGPSAVADTSALVVREVASASLAKDLVQQVQVWLEGGVRPDEIAVLTRVNAQLLAPQIALSEARLDVSHVVFENILERVGLRAFLAYLRMAGSPKKMAPADVIEVLKRPSYGLPPWFADRIRKKKSWTLTDIRLIGSTMTSRESEKLDRLVDNLELLANIVRKGGHVADVLRCIRDVIGLDAAMELLDNSKKSEGSSHLDDLDALLQVAALEPDPLKFEGWLRQALRGPGRSGSSQGDETEIDPQFINAQMATSQITASQITLATIHRVKGREWPRVVLFGVNDGVIPHRLSEDDEEERRVLHVGVTRGRDQVIVLTDPNRRSPFLDELDGSAPRRSLAATAALRSAAALAAPSGKSSKQSGPTSSVVASVAVEDEPLFEALRAWRRQRATADKVSAFIVLPDKTLRAICAAKPTSLVQFARVDGIGPTKLDLYGDEVLEVIRPLISG